MVTLGCGVFTSNMFLAMGNPWFFGPQLLEFSQIYMPSLSTPTTHSTAWPSGNQWWQLDISINLPVEFEDFSYIFPYLSIFFHIFLYWKPLNGNSRILKWRYVSTIIMFGHILLGYSLTRILKFPWNIHLLRGFWWFSCQRCRKNLPGAWAAPQQPWASAASGDASLGRAGERRVGALVKTMGFRWFSYGFL